MEFVASFSKDSWFLVKKEKSRFMQRNSLPRNKGNHKLVRLGSKKHTKTRKRRSKDKVKMRF